MPTATERLEELHKDLVSANMQVASTMAKIKDVYRNCSHDWDEGVEKNYVAAHVAVLRKLQAAPGGTGVSSTVDACDTCGLSRIRLFLMKPREFKHHTTFTAYFDRYGQVEL